MCNFQIIRMLVCILSTGFAPQRAIVWDNYKFAMEKLTWKAAAIKCREEFNNASLYPLRNSWKSSANTDLDRFGLESLWVGLESSIGLQWLNGTDTGKSLPRHHIVGECLLFDDNSLFGVACQQKKSVLCKRADGYKCGDTVMTWHEAKDFCTSRKSEIWPGFVLPKDPSLTCLGSDSGFWVGVRLVRVAKTITWRSDISPTYKKDCLVLAENRMTKCGLLRKRAGQVTCELVSCTEKHPYLCDEEPRPVVPEIEEFKKFATEDNPTGVLQNRPSGTFANKPGVKGSAPGLIAVLVIIPAVTVTVLVIAGLVIYRRNCHQHGKRMARRIYRPVWERYRNVDVRGLSIAVICADGVVRLTPGRSAGSNGLALETDYGDTGANYSSLRHDAGSEKTDSFLDAGSAIKDRKDSQPINEYQCGRIFSSPIGETVEKPKPNQDVNPYRNAPGPTGGYETPVEGPSGVTKQRILQLRAEGVPQPPTGY